MLVNHIIYYNKHCLLKNKLFLEWSAGVFKLFYVMSGRPSFGRNNLNTFLILVHHTVRRNSLTQLFISIIILACLVWIALLRSCRSGRGQDSDGSWVQKMYFPLLKPFCGWFFFCEVSLCDYPAPFGFRLCLSTVCLRGKWKHVSRSLTNGLGLACFCREIALWLLPCRGGIQPGPAATILYWYLGHGMRGLWCINGTVQAKMKILVSIHPYVIPNLTFFSEDILRLIFVK